jgi:hypothetical protein
MAGGSGAGGSASQSAQGAEGSGLFNGNNASSYSPNTGSYLPANYRERMNAFVAANPNRPEYGTGSGSQQPQQPPQNTPGPATPPYSAPTIYNPYSPADQRQFGFQIPHQLQQNQFSSQLGGVGGYNPMPQFQNPFGPQQQQGGFSDNPQMSQQQQQMLRDRVAQLQQPTQQPGGLGAAGQGQLNQLLQAAQQRSQQGPDAGMQAAFAGVQRDRAIADSNGPMDPARLAQFQANAAGQAAQANMSPQQQQELFQRAINTYNPRGQQQYQAAMATQQPQGASPGVNVAEEYNPNQMNPAFQGMSQADRLRAALDDSGMGRGMTMDMPQRYGGQQQFNPYQQQRPNPYQMYGGLSSLFRTQDAYSQRPAPTTQAQLNEANRQRLENQRNTVQQPTQQAVRQQAQSGAFDPLYGIQF